MAKVKELAPAVELNQIWQDRKSPARYLKVTELHGSLARMVNIDTAKVHEAFPIATLQKGFRLTGEARAS